MEEIGAADRTRTYDPIITNDVLYQLSYSGVSRVSGQARMVRAQFDLLCMDEPTNHLDVSGTEGLEQALKEFPGTIVIVTHDRKLASELCDRVLWVERGAVRTFDGGLEPCLQALAQERSVLRQQQSAQKEQRRAQEQPAASKPKEPGKIRNPILFEKLEARIMELEEALEQTRGDRLSPDNDSSAQKMQDLQARGLFSMSLRKRAVPCWNNCFRMLLSRITMPLRSTTVSTAQSRPRSS